MEIFEQAYRDGPPPWEIGRAQREFVALEETGEIAGDVLDVGCGTGENALFLAGRGHMVRGVDAVPAAIERARQKAEERGIAATFQVADALDLTALGRTFETVIDSVSSTPSPTTIAPGLSGAWPRYSHPAGPISCSPSAISIPGGPRSSA